jgi:hypothetical protein
LEPTRFSRRPSRLPCEADHGVRLGPGSWIDETHGLHGPKVRVCRPRRAMTSTGRQPSKNRGSSKDLTGTSRPVVRASQKRSYSSRSGGSSNNPLHRLRSGKPRRPGLRRWIRGDDRGDGVVEIELLPSARTQVLGQGPMQGDRRRPQGPFPGQVDDLPADNGDVRPEGQELLSTQREKACRSTARARPAGMAASSAAAMIRESSGASPPSRAPGVFTEPDAGSCYRPVPPSPPTGGPGKAFVSTRRDAQECSPEQLPGGLAARQTAADEDDGLLHGGDITSYPSFS